MQTLRYFVLFLGITAILTSCGKFEKLRKKGTDEEKYQAALAYYKKGSWDKAVLLFEELKPILKGSDQQEMANFYEAYCNYNLQQYEVASFQFKRFYETFGRSDYAEEALYMSAYASHRASMPFYLDQASTLTSMDALQSFINSYPQSKFVEEASKIIKESRRKLERKAYERAKLYYKTSPTNLQNFRAAVYAVNNFQREFPDSDYNEELAFLRVQAQFDFAENSLYTKQKERYADALKYYQEFVDGFPKSKYLKKAERFYEESVSKTAKLEEAERLAKAAAEKEKESQPNAAGRLGGAN
ncbi:outer membrane protein assembly factor BamD [Siphonobacter aquaeclarae]|jgi:outer membrane protein assembly factor BamD|uniref:Beta-barrel assembly machine subunit BamD n=1 Tax=Siphonobacter aquaeclarae TaxID=563176 RepID=A0A1G9X1V3_9BACT|nr:outer membrane protein assembly factor BamD [Siphonobacter aquaeclarae]SDM90688.1 Beta-barrel assembly machine subunit BamD [Siphonobacter aquaeclarae]